MSITPDDLDWLPNHTETLENIAQRDEVDALLPRHLGNAERGRFATGFIIVCGNHVRTFALHGDEPSFEVVYEFTAENEVLSFGSVWNTLLVFQGEDRFNGAQAQTYIACYSTQYTLGYEITEDQIEEVIEETEDRDYHTPLDECDCHNHREIEDEIDSLSLVVRICEECRRPQAVELDSGAAAIHDSALQSDWLTEFGGHNATTFSFENNQYLPVSGDNAGPEDATLHLLSRQSHLEYENFGLYTGDTQKGLLALRDGEVAGYLLWNQPKDGEITCLQQVYVRESFRGRGIGRDLVQAWYDEICPDKDYFAVDPSDDGLAFLEEIDHVGDEKSPAKPAEIAHAHDELDADSVDAAAARDLRFGSGPI